MTGIEIHFNRQAAVSPAATHDQNWINRPSEPEAPWAIAIIV